jgi:hypothetical protein
MKSIIESLGDCRFRSPLPHMDGHRARFKLDSDQIVCDDRLNRENVHDAAEEPSLTFEVAGPRDSMVIGDRRKIAPDGDIWRSVLEATGQPPRMDCSPSKKGGVQIQSSPPH